MGGFWIYAVDLSALGFGRGSGFGKFWTGLSGHVSPLQSDQQQSGTLAGKRC